MTTSMNERTHFFIKIFLSLFILERVDVGYVWEVSWRRGQTATYWPQVLLTIAALLSHSGWAAQPWVTEGPSPLSRAGFHSAGILSPTGTATGTDSSRLWHLVISLFDIHLLPVGVRICHHHWIQQRPQVKVSSTGCTCFAVLPLIYTGASLDWRLGRGSICYTCSKCSFSICLYRAIFSLQMKNLRLPIWRIQPRKHINYKLWIFVLLKKN